jgi:hypothetical protein
VGIIVLDLKLNKKGKEVGEGIHSYQTNEHLIMRKLRIGIIGTGVGLRTHYPGFSSTNAVRFGIYSSTSS